MSYYIRKIKFESNADLLRSQIDIPELFGDVISEYNISNNGDLSVWKIDDIKDKDTLEKILLAIVISTPVCEDTTFLIMNDDILKKYGFEIPVKGASGENYCPEWEDLHYNIKDIRLKNIITCLSMYRDLLQNDDLNSPKNIIYINGAKLAEIILKALMNNTNNILERNIKCNKSIKENYSALYSKYDPAIKQKRKALKQKT